MTTYRTGNPIGSTDPRDLFDNAENLDEALLTDQPTFTDRLGRTRVSWDGAIAYSVLSDTYGAGIEVTTRNQVILANGEYWKVAGSTTLPYTTNGAGMPEGGAFVSVGDAVLRSDLASSSGTDLVGFGSKTLTSALVERALYAEKGADVVLGELVSGQEVFVEGKPFKLRAGILEPLALVPISFFGAVGDGVADDTAAVREAVASGYPLYWGTSDKIYRTTEAILETITHQIVWKSDGATVLLDSISPERVVLGFNLTPKDHWIDGILKIDAGMNSYVGLLLACAETSGGYPDAYANLLAVSIQVSNVYRSGTLYSYGAGITVRGSWDNVIFFSPDIRNVVLAAGAGIPGTVGVEGISVTNSTANSQPQRVLVCGGYISEIKSEDLNYFSDQDGIKLIADPGASIASESSAVIRDTIFRNCYGRSIKVQFENSLVAGCRITRRAGWNPGGTNFDIDFQEGGGKIRDLECYYVGFAPTYIVNFSTTRSGGKKVPMSRISGMTVNLGAGSSITGVFRNTVFSTNTDQIIKVSDLEVVGVGDLTYLATFESGNAGDGFHLSLDNVTAGPSSNEWVACSNTAGTGTLKASNCIHTGSSPAHLRRANFPAWRPSVSAREMINFIEQTNGINGASLFGVVERVGLVTDQSDVAGVAYPISFSLEDGETFTFPARGGNLNCGLVMVTTLAKLSSGLISRDRALGCEKIAGGAQLVAGGLADPGTGQVRVWYDQAETAMKLSNHQGGVRNFTCFIVG